MSEPITFSTAAFGGFEKKQVLDYIYQMHETADKTEQQYKKQISEISYAYKELQKRAAAAEKRVAELELQQLVVPPDNSSSTAHLQKIQQLEQQLSSSNTKVEKLQQLLQENQKNSSETKVSMENAEDNSFVEEQLTEANKRILYLQQSLAESQRLLSEKNQVSTPNIISSANKSPELSDEQRIDETSAKIGRVILDAHSKAEQIINDAQTEAKRLLSEAENTITQQKLTTNAMLEQQRTAVLAEAEAIIEKAKMQTSEKIQNTEQHAHALMSHITTISEKATKQIHLLETNLAELTKTTASTLQEMQSYATLNGPLDHSEHK